MNGLLVPRVGLSMLAGLALLCCAPPLLANDNKTPKSPEIIRSAQSGSWSSPTTWTGGTVPGTGARVLIREGHRVVYDIQSDQVIRAINIAGVLEFANSKDTRLDVGLIKIQASDEYSEEGFDCELHVAEPDPKKPRPALQVGTPDRPIDAGRTALIRLTYVDGLDKQSCPAIVCCGGRMDFHGTPLSRSWVNLAATAKKVDASVTVAEPVKGWKVGDRVILTGTKLTYTKSNGTEERTIQAIDGAKLTLNQPLEFEHKGEGTNLGEVANLSRNVIVESADPKVERGHTMYHRHSAGSISYAEFRHLGKKDVLGRYAIHFHLVRDTMRGSSVIGASIWDSHNRWLTIHGTDYLLVRDCVGYQSIGHGFFMEDATEQYNVLDRNLAVQAKRGKKLPKQILPFDDNDGAGFWWANGRNTFTRNVSCDNEQYGYFFDIATDKVDVPMRVPDGTTQKRDVRNVPFFCFEENEAHTQQLYGFKFGTDRDSRLIRGDRQHPFIVRNLKVWETHYNLQPSLAYFLLDGLKLSGGTYSIYRPEYDHHVYRNMQFDHISFRGLGRAGIADAGGYEAVSVQQGPFTCENITFEDSRCQQPFFAFNTAGSKPGQVGHFRNIVVKNSQAKEGTVNDYVPLEVKREHGVSYYFHDFPEKGKTIKVVGTYFPDLMKDGTYRSIDGFTGTRVRATDVKGVEFPVLLDPVDDLPPATVITHVSRARGKLIVRGITSDNGTVKRVLVNGTSARAVRDNFAEWEVILDEPRGELKLTAHAEDAAGNVEKSAHERWVR